MIDAYTDHIALTRLIGDYCHGFDKRQWDRFANVWHPQAEWEIEPELFVGKADILRRARWMWQSIHHSYHHNANPVFDVEGDTGTGLVDVLAGWRSTDGLRFTGVGTYYDTYVRTAHGWLIARRRAPQLEITAITNPDGLPARLD